jgi:predicted glutamine amidotransferase
MHEDLCYSNYMDNKNLIMFVSCQSGRDRIEAPERGSDGPSGRKDVDVCRLLGLVSASGSSLRTLLGARQCDRFLSMSRLHADGWGTAWRDGSADARVERMRDPLPPALGGTARAAWQALDSEARARLMHLRQATPGVPVTEANTHPFLADGIAFAHNGAISPKAELRGLVQSAFRDSVEGETDSELYFALVRQHAQRSGDLFDGVCEAVRVLRERFPLASLNALLLSDAHLIVVHSSENSRISATEFAASGLSDAELPLGHLDRYFQMSCLPLPDGSTIFASTGIDTTGWTPLAPATVTRVDLTTLVLDSRSLIEDSVGSLR